jgi:hypothetical protein
MSKSKEPTAAQQPETPASRLVAHLQACEAHAAELQAAFVATQDAAARLAPRQARPAAEASRLIADARANDALRGTNDAAALVERFDREAKEIEAARVAQSKAEAEAKRIGQEHAQAQADVQAARTALEKFVSSEAEKHVEKARARYGEALQSLIDANEEFLVALATARGGNVPGNLLLPSLPTFGCSITSAIAQVGDGRVYFTDQVFAASTVYSKVSALRHSILEAKNAQ